MLYKESLSAAGHEMRNCKIVTETDKQRMATSYYCEIILGQSTQQNYTAENSLKVKVWDIISYCIGNNILKMLDLKVLNNDGEL